MSSFGNIFHYFPPIHFRALDVDSNNVIEFTDFVVCFSITSFGNLNEKISLAFKIYDLGK